MNIPNFTKVVTQPHLYLPIGPPGCGKSSLAKRMARLGVFDWDAVVSPDHYRTILTGKVGDQSENGAVFAICRKIARARMERKLPVYFDSTNLKEDWRADVVNLAAAYEMPVVSIVFILDEKTCRTNNASAHRFHTGARVPDDVMDMMWETYYKERVSSALPGTIVTADSLESMLNVMAAAQEP